MFKSGVSVNNSLAALGFDVREVEWEGGSSQFPGSVGSAASLEVHAEVEGSLAILPVRHFVCWSSMARRGAHLKNNVN